MMKLQIGQKVATWLVLMGLMLWIAPPAQAVELTEEGIRIRGAHGLEVSFKPYKRHYRTGEPVRFKVEGNKRFYLYLFSLDKDKDEAIMLLPNRYDRNNRYRADRTYTIPSKAEFYGDKPGREKLVVIASTRKLKFSESEFWPDDEDDFYDFGSADRASDIIEGLTIDNLPAEDDLVIKSLSLRIYGDDISDNASNDFDYDVPVVVVSTDESRYRKDDAIRIAYGSDEPGWIHLFMEYPDGEIERIKRKKVDGDGLYRMFIDADRPFGIYAIHAVFSKHKRYTLKGFSNNEAIRIRGKDRSAGATTEYRVSR